VGGETWKAGSSHAITWSASDNVGVTAIDLAYSTDGGSTYPNSIATGLSNSGSYTWTVANAPSTTVRVRATAHDAAGNTGSGASASNFTIDRWTITASAGTGGTITPNGAVAVVQGANQSFAIAANSGFTISSVLVDGASVGAVSGYTFSNVTASHTISASFVAGSPSAWSMSSGNYSENFADIANWANDFASGIGASVWHSVPVQSTGTIPDGVKTTVSTATFTSGTSGGVQRGTGNIVLLSTGTTDNTSSDAIDVYFDYTGFQAGTLTYDWSVVFNSTGDRKGSLRVYTSTNGTTFTELSAADVLNFTNNVAGSGTISSVALPSSFGNAPGARLRFYYCNGTGGTTGSRPKIAIDNVAVTAGGPFSVFHAPTDDGTPAPAHWELALSRPQPNPAQSAGTTLAFTLPQAGSATLEVLDVSGRRVWSAAGSWSAGPHDVRWSGDDAAGGAAHAGVYFVRLVTPFGERTARLVRL
jgi:hypothetical protein